MTSRATQQRYQPPGRRHDASDPAAREQRGLEGAATSLSQVRLVVLRPGEDDVENCPLDVEAQAGSSTHYSIFFPERLPAELLHWFGEQFGGGAGRLEFPPMLSKHERARWHHAADQERLHTESVGIGEGRYLTISTAAATTTAASSEDGGGGRLSIGAAAPAAPAVPAPGTSSSSSSSRRLSREQQATVRQIYDCCQTEGGKYWEYSRGEVEAMVASGETLPADVQAVVDKRLRGGRVHQLLREGKPSEALALLADDSKLAWIKDTQTGGYPIHAAAWKGYESVVLYLSSLPGVLEQRDGRRDTALAVARLRRHTAVQQVLLEAGADPERASYRGAPVSSSSGGRGTAAASAAEKSDEHTMRATEERRSRARPGGSAGGSGGAPPGLHVRGGGRGGRGRQAGPPAGSSMQAEEQQQEEEEEELQCPW